MLLLLVISYFLASNIILYFIQLLFIYLFISIQHEKKHGKCSNSKSSSAYFDNRIDIEQETDKLIADNSFGEFSFFKDDDDMCA